MYGNIFITYVMNSDWRKSKVNQLTEAEIKKDFDWAWQFCERGGIMNLPKFRAWFKQGSKMVNVATIDFLEKEVKSHANVMYSFDEIELMQSTGLIDKNGEEIFEGGCFY